MDILEIKLDSLMRGTFSDKRGPELAISAEMPGTVVLQIRSKNGQYSDWVEVGNGVLINALIALANHDIDINVRYDKRYSDYTKMLEYKEQEKEVDNDVN